MFLKRALCRTGKWRFPSQASAIAEIVRLRDEFKGDPEKLPRRAYPCSHCGGWHLTSMKRGE